MWEKRGESMSQLHELTEKIMNSDGDFKGYFMDLDSIIRKYLEEKAKEIDYESYPYTCCPEKILGLTEKEKPVEEVKVEKWCEHIWKYKPVQPKKGVDYSNPWWEGKDWSGQVVRTFSQCPICGTPRPTPKSKREELAAKFAHRFCLNTSPSMGELADIAIAFLESNNAK